MTEKEKEELVKEAQKYLHRELVVKVLYDINEGYVPTNYKFIAIGKPLLFIEENGTETVYIDGILESKEGKKKGLPLNKIVKEFQRQAK